MPPPPKSPIEVERRNRFLSGTADEVQCAAQRNVVEVVTGSVGQRTLLSPTGDASVHQSRVALEASVRSESKTLRDTRSKTLEQSVGGFDQAQDGVNGARILQVAGQ